MAWYGESYALDSDQPAWRNHFDDTSAPLADGDEVIVGAYADSYDRAAFTAYAEPIVARWVVEVAGGAGSFDLWAGVDPDWSYTDPSLATQFLGTLTANGPGTLVSEPLAVIDHAGLIAQNAAVIARLKGTSGSLDISQVKLRVWPASGASGAYVSAGDGMAHGVDVQRWNTLGVPDSDNTGLITATVGHEDYPDPKASGAALDAELEVQTLLASKAGKPAYFGSINELRTGELASAQSGAEARLFVIFAIPNQYFYSGLAYARAGLGFIRADISRAAPELDVGFEYGPDPHEHQYENEAFGRPVGGGPLRPTFAGWTTAAVEVTYATSAGTTSWAEGEALLRIQGVSDTFTPGPIFPYQVSTGGVVTRIKPVLLQSSVVQRVGLSGAQSLLVSVVTPGTEPSGESARGLEDADFFGDPVHAYGFNVSARVDVVDTGHLIAFGPIEVWSPTAVAVKERKPRFYVTFTEVDDDPRDVSHVVGIGKPANDLSIFRVPTPLGTLRELRHGEKVSDVSVAYPLKVKLEDGSWTVVAGMTPDP